MLQTILTILIILAAALWLARLAYRTFTQTSGCGPSCHCAHKDSSASTETPASATPQTVFFHADDLVRRVKARRPPA